VAPESLPSDPEVLLSDGSRLLLAVEDPAFSPGVRLALYVTELRPDPRTGERVPGHRYAGDARVAWVGPDLVELALAHPGPVAEGTAVTLGPPLAAAPTPAWRAPEPEPLPREVVVAAAPPPAPPPPPPEPFFFDVDLTGAELGRVTDGPALHPMSVALEGGFAGDGYGTGFGWGAVAWSVRPQRGPARVELRLEGLRGERWVEGKGDEPWSTEPAAGYWLLGRVDSPGVGLAGFATVGAGVDDVGPGFALGLGVRTGHLDRSHVSLAWDGRGRMGNRFVLDGRVALSDALRVGLRGRVGTLPLHQGDFRQWRSDAALVVDAVVRERWALSGAVGAGAYDWLWRDAGLVADGRLEVRW